MLSVKNELLVRLPNPDSLIAVYSQDNCVAGKNLTLREVCDTISTWVAARELNNNKLVITVFYSTLG